MTREEWSVRNRRRRAEESVQKLPGHGHARHGSHTTIADQTERVRTGQSPDGAIGKKVSRVTTFNSPEAELEAVGKAKQKAGRPPNDNDEITHSGQVQRSRKTVVVNGRPDGYGAGVEVMRDSQGKPLPGRPVQLTGEEPNALVVLEWNPETRTWEPVTQHPTNKPMTS